MAVTVSMTVSGGTVEERQQLHSAVQTMWPKPISWVDTDAVWSKEAVIRFLEQVLNDAVVNAAAKSAADAARATPIRLVRG